MVQWLRIHLPMQGTQVQSLVQEDARCLGASKPVCRHSYRVHEPQSLCSATEEATVMRSQCTSAGEYPLLPQPEKACMQQ